MGYSVPSQVFSRCIAGGNGVKQLQHGLEGFMAYGIPATKLVLGMSWGGASWECTNFVGDTGLDYCEPPMETSLAGYRGVNCTDAVSDACGNLDNCWERLTAPNTVYHGWDDYTKLPYFNYVTPLNGSDTKLYQVWYESPESIGHKVTLAKNMGVGGVGPWEFGKLNWTKPEQVYDVWSQFCKFFDCDEYAECSDGSCHKS